MTDHGHALEFGFFPTPEAARLDHVVALVRQAEAAGLDLVSLQDHPYQERYADTWTVLSALGAMTNTIKLSPNVASLPLRPPVMLAKAAATLDLLTGGRVELGLGAGAFWDAIAAAGGERRTPREAVDALAEAVALIKQFWAGGTVNFAGEHYQAKGLHAGPAPAHDIPIWIGAYKPRMLRLTAELADAWVPSLGYATPEAMVGLTRTLDEAALAAGRDPAEIKRIYNIHGRFGSSAGLLEGTPRDWAEQLAELTLGLGISAYILATDDPTVLRTYAEEVAPAVRELVDAERVNPANQEIPRETAQAQQVEPAAPARVASQQGGLQVEATPDDGTRLAREAAWDESTRPTWSEPAEATYHPQLQASAQHLVDIHDGLRGELRQVRDVLDQVRSGHLQVGAARSVINTMTMRQNNWTLGAYCESYCRIVTGHHTLEDRSVFPHLRRSEPGLAPVIDRLEEEHHVIHDVLEQFDRALVRLVAEEGSGQHGTEVLDGVQAALDLLTDTLLSHLAYEERELIGPLARHGLQ